MVINNATNYQTTQYNVITGGASNQINNVAPSATSGVPLISQGANSQPLFGTAVVAGGGTGAVTFTAYAVICAGTTATGAFQNVSGVGSSGQVLTSNGAAALPTWQAAAGGGMTWADASGTFNAVVGNGYFITGASTVTMPASPSVGNTIAFILDAAALLTITGNTSQLLRIGSTVSAAAGTCASSTQGNAVQFIYRATNTAWEAISSIGTWTVT